MSIELSICGCMGPQGNDPLCPCAMRRAGLIPSTDWTEEKKQELVSVLEKYMRKENVDIQVKKE